jgi:hypothetical protein
MKTYLLAAMMLVLIGGGCVASTTPESEADQAWEAAFPSGSWQFANTDAYVLPVDHDFTLEQTGDSVRIQNFVGSDDPYFAYPDEAFFIEIRPTTESWQSFATGFESTEDVTLAGEPATRGNDRLPGGESWPGHSYHVGSKGTYIGLFYLHPEGEALAEAVIQQINWQ